MKSSHITAVFVAVCAALSAGCAEGGGKALEKVRLNEVVHSIFYAPQYAAIEMGYFEEEGLEIELTAGQGADKSMVALLSGEADIALMGTEAALYVFNEGREDYAVAFAQLTQTAGNFLVAREPGEDFKWEDVKGKTIIGGRAGGMPQMMLEYVLRKNGIEPGVDVEIIQNLQFTSTAGAFAGGVGDYTAEFDPAARNLELNGGGFVVASVGAAAGSVPYTVYMAKQSYYKEHGDIIQKFTNAVYKGQQFVAAHTPEETAALIARHFSETSTGELAYMIRRYQEQGAYKDGPSFDKEGFERLQDVMQASGELEKRVGFNDIATNEYAGNVKK